MLQYIIHCGHCSRDCLLGIIRLMSVYICYLFELPMLNTFGSKFNRAGALFIMVLISHPPFHYLTQGSKLNNPSLLCSNASIPTPIVSFRKTSISGV